MAIAASTQSLTGVQVAMDLFQHRYYRKNKKMLTLIGQWPYQTIRARCGFFAVLLFLTTSHAVPQIMAIVKYHDDWEFFLECVGPLMMVVSCSMKFIYSTWYSQEMLQMLNRIRTDWHMWAQDPEVNFLHKYAERGGNMTIVYAVTIYSTGIIFFTEPIIPKIIDVILMNGSQPGEFPVPVYYYHLNAQKYYFYIIMHSYTCMSAGFLITIANDAMFIVFVQHGCGIFSALGHKLERIGKNKKSSETGHVLDKRDITFEQLVSCIDRHNNAIEYAELIEVTYSWRLFFVMGFSMLGISITGLQIVKKSNYNQGTTRFIISLLAQLMHVYIESYMSQMLMDHSISIRYYIHNGKWYRLTRKAQKLLQFMMMRCNLPCKLTAGKISIMSMKTFGVLLKTSLSYFTLLRSI